MDYDTRPRVNYLPAQLSSGASHIVYFSVRNPQTGKFHRIRHKFNHIKDDAVRYRAMMDAKKEINLRLKNGWNPIAEELAENSTKSLHAGIDLYISTFMPEREDSIRTYRSIIGMFVTWASREGLINRPSHQFTKEHALSFVNEMTRKKNLGPRTFNNYVGVLRGLFTRLKEQQYVFENPFEGIKKKRTSTKNRCVIPDESLHEIFEYLAEKDPSYELICQIILHCGIRPTELCFLKPKNVRADMNVIQFLATQTKNKKAESVTVPAHIMQRLIMHIGVSPNEYYIFSNDRNLLPGKVKANPRDLSRMWHRMRRALVLPVEYKLYSLKDTGATKMAYLLQPKELQEQMRHSSLEITQTYISESRPTANPRIVNLNLLND